jgi:tRNA-specific 2-thiouridylase
MKGPVLVAMSGGVDSSVSAGLLREAGYAVMGVTMLLYGGYDSPHLEKAAKAASILGIPHSVVDYRELFRERIVSYFLGEYERGNTPNPCVLCNEIIKFGLLSEKAAELGAPLIATGHYARIIRHFGTAPGSPAEDLPVGGGLAEGTAVGGGSSGGVSADGLPAEGFPAGGVLRLFKGVDRSKDQSYFLYRLSRSQLERTIFPLGDLFKADVRAKAKALRLPAPEEPESQEICFVQGMDYRDFIENAWAPAAAGTPASDPSGAPTESALIARAAGSAGSGGPIVDGAGNVLGTHEGIYRYTVGQRRGLGLSSPVPLYVTAIDRSRNAVVVGPREDVEHDRLIASRVLWIAESPRRPLRVTAKIRSFHTPAPALLTRAEDGTVLLEFDELQWAITPGQSAVFYDGEEVLGGGVIERGWRHRREKGTGGFNPGYNPGFNLPRDRADGLPPAAEPEKTDMSKPPGGPVHARTDTLPVLRFRAERGEHFRDTLVAETPFTLRLNGEELVTILCTPEHLVELAAGYLYSEGFIGKKEDIVGLSFDDTEPSAHVRTSVVVNARELYEKRKRLITPGCIDAAGIQAPGPDARPPGIKKARLSIRAADIREALREATRLAELYRETGGVHNAALCAGSAVLFFSEDIGRHNALDKVVGHSLLAGIPLDDKTVITSGRISSPVVMKMARAGVPVLVSRSAPTSEAARLAEAFGLTLIGFARGNRFNVYSNAWRMERG